MAKTKDRPSINDQTLALRRAGAFALLNGFGVVKIAGPDAASFLQARSTNDVLALTDGSGESNSLLDRTGHLQAYFSLHLIEEAFIAIIDSASVPRFIEELERFHIREEFKIADSSSEWVAIAVQGPLSRKILRIAIENFPEDMLEYDIRKTQFWRRDCLIARRSITGEEGYIILVLLRDADPILKELRRVGSEHGFVELSSEALDLAQLEAGLPRFNVDIGPEDLLTDTGPQEETVSYTKGCYVGQEVVARIKTYSAPRKALVGLEFSEDILEPPPFGADCQRNGERIGSLKSSFWSPTLRKVIALAYLAREHRTPGDLLELEIAGKNYKASPALLPFYKAKSAQERARSLYEKGLSEFASGDENQAIAMLSEALEFNPAYLDCCESLGVMLSRRGELDEAIALMKRLAELDASSVMAHTNLSIFYMQQGNKDAAEEEKAIAMSLQMAKIAAQARSEMQQEEDDRIRIEDIRHRMGMFREVLGIDNEDQLANYGLGNLHVEVGEHAEAVPLLEKAIALKPSHTVAYLALGTAYEGLRDTENAIATYKLGITVASNRGDMQPLKKMQARLASLTV